MCRHHGLHEPPIAMTHPMPKRPLETPRASEQVCQRIRELVTSGVLKSGDKLPPERELAAFLGIGRGVLREALRSLEIAGLVTSKKGRAGGTFIHRQEARHMTTALGDMMHLGTVTLTDLTEARVLFMTDAIRLACERATEADFDAMDRNIDATEAHTLRGEYEQRRQVAIDFYRLVAAASKNQVLVVTVEATTEILREFLQAPNTRPLEPLIRSRRRFMKHLRARDAAHATSELTTHLKGLHQYILANAARRAEAARRSSLQAAEP